MIAVMDNPSNNNQNVPTPNPEVPRGTVSTIRRVFALLVVIAGLFLGLFLAFAVNFCMKNCHPTFLQKTAYIWGPLGSLLITVPIAKSIRKIR
jgi:hypothetical protein